MKLSKMNQHKYHVYDNDDDDASKTSVIIQANLLQIISRSHRLS